VLIRFGIATRFTELVENPLHTRLYNLENYYYYYYSSISACSPRAGTDNIHICASL
jgi:hypothetical protein